MTDSDFRNDFSRIEHRCTGGNVSDPLAGERERLSLTHVGLVGREVGCTTDGPDRRVLA